MNTKNQEEIVKTLATSHNLEAAQSVFLNYPKVFDYLAKKYFNPKMEKFAEQNELKYYYEEAEESYIKFELAKDGFKEKLEIEFKLEKVSNSFSYFYGISDNPKNSKLSLENKELLHEKIKEKGISINEKKWFPFYENIENLTITSWENDIVNSNNFFESCKQKIEILLGILKEIGLY